MNWGRAIAFVQIALGLASAVGYWLAGDRRRAIYFFFGACITGSVTF